MIDTQLMPDYIFESSWEVCNKVGGIYTVLSTRANTLVQKFKNHILFIGPDVWRDRVNKSFIEDNGLLSEWREYAKKNDDLNLRIGRWNIPGEPITILVDFEPFYSQKNEIYARAWELFQVDSLHAYGDYDEASMFSYAAGKVVESYYHYNLTTDNSVIYQAHEWMTGLGALFLKESIPQIATIFTTHATSIGRSIAGNNKPLYDYLFAYNGDQMASELNMESKHSVEKQTAYLVDCFTTVSDITNCECKELLEKPADVILKNGFENDFVPQGITFTNKRKRARKKMLNLVNCLTGCKIGNDALIVGTSGRYEFLNKGINVFIDAMNILNHCTDLSREIVAFVNVPGWVSEPRLDLIDRLKSRETFHDPLPFPNVTHQLHDMNNDPVLGMLNYLGMSNSPEDKVKVIFVPCYLDGNDGIFNLDYYDVIIGNDISVYPSYYEPWGYTPLESIAFHVPTITTDLSGFGLWVKTLKNWKGLHEGVSVVHRSDYNYQQVVDEIKDNLLNFSKLNEEDVTKIQANASDIAEKALWKHFIKYYYEAYDVALRKAQQRVKVIENDKSIK